MFPNDTDKAWEYYGKIDPYYGVATAEENRTSYLTQDARSKFFDSGTQYIELILRLVHDHLDSSFKPTQALDFGCGVGRLVIPLARICKSVTGIDISESMIEEAKNNCRERGVSNVTFVKSNDSLSGVSGSFDLINSFIVFQHIPPRRGKVILQKLVGKLQENGIGVLHFTYFGKESLGRKLLIEAYKSIPFLFGLRNLLKGKPISEPMMQMNEYNLNDLFKILQESGCHRCHIRFTDHGMYGVIILFQKGHLDIL
jgi:SAM-dependent methyltransferase